MKAHSLFSPIFRMLTEVSVLAVAASVAATFSIANGQITSTFQQSGTSETAKQWSNPGNWDTDNYPDSGQGGSYTAVIDRGTVNGAVTSRNGTFSGGQLTAGTLHITGTFRGISGAQIEADNTFSGGSY